MCFRPRQSTASLLQDDDGFLVGETERAARARVEPKPAGAELARPGVAALLQQLDAGLARLPEKCVSEHGFLVGERTVTQRGVKPRAVTGVVR